MILFVFEGGKAEPLVFDSLAKLYLKDEEVRVVTCEHDLPTLFSRLRKNGYDLFRSLPLKENGIEVPEGARMDTLFSQIFLFFDYDFQNAIGVEKVNEILGEMLEYFDDETENGKLYVNYPMIESLKYTKDLPDADYCNYVVSRKVCTEHKFKGLSETFACASAKQYRFIDLKKTPTEEVKQSWDLLREQNIRKANYICNGKNVIPDKKDVISQDKIFAAQKEKYVEESNSVSILNSFPIFLFEYLR